MNGPIYFDLRGNIGYNYEYHKKVINEIFKNIKEFKLHEKGFKRAVNRGWITQELIQYREYNESVELTYPKPIIIRHKKIESRKEEVKDNHQHQDKIPKFVKRTLILKKSASSPKLGDDSEIDQDVMSLSCYADFGYKGGKECDGCAIYFKEFMESESRCIAFAMEIKRLQRQVSIKDYKNVFAFYY